MIQKMLSPSGPSANALSFKVGISQPTLSKWVKECGKEPSMKKRNKHWSKKQKLAAIEQVANITEEDRGAYLRKHGLFNRDIADWRHELCEKEDPSEKRQLKKKVHTLEKEIRRKDKALAEASALLILKKKMDLIWGSNEEDEQV